MEYCHEVLVCNDGQGQAIKPSTWSITGFHNTPLQVAAPIVVSSRAVALRKAVAVSPNRHTYARLPKAFQDSNLPVFHDPGQVCEVQSQYEYLPQGLVDAESAQPIIQHLTLSGSLGQAPVL